MGQIFGVLSSGSFRGTDFPYKASHGVLNAVSTYSNVKIGIEKPQFPRESENYWRELIAIGEERNCRFSFLDDFDISPIEQKVVPLQGKIMNLKVSDDDRQIVAVQINYYLTMICTTGRLARLLHNMQEEPPQVLMLSNGNADYFYRQREQLAGVGICIDEFVGYEKPPHNIGRVLINEYRSASLADAQIPRNSFIVGQQEDDGQPGAELFDPDICVSANDIRRLEEDHKSYLKIFEAAYEKDETLEFAHHLLDMYKVIGGQVSFEDIKKLSKDVLRKFDFRWN